MRKNKPIIIDGVDVNECPCFSNWHTIITGDGIVYKEVENSCTPKQKPCKDIKDCCFKKLTKQLTRKTDVCERLDYKIGLLERNIDNLKAEKQQAEQKLERIRDLIGSNNVYLEDDCGINNITGKLLQIIDEVEQ